MCRVVRTVALDDSAQQVRVDLLTVPLLFDEAEQGVDEPALLRVEHVVAPDDQRKLWKWEGGEQRPGQQQVHECGIPRRAA